MSSFSIQQLFMRIYNIAVICASAQYCVSCEMWVHVSWSTQQIILRIFLRIKTTNRTKNKYIFRNRKACTVFYMCIALIMCQQHQRKHANRSSSSKQPIQSESELLLYLFILFLCLFHTYLATFSMCQPNRAERKKNTEFICTYLVALRLTCSASVIAKFIIPSYIRQSLRFDQRDTMILTINATRA